MSLLLIKEIVVLCIHHIPIFIYSLVRLVVMSLRAFDGFCMEWLVLVVMRSFFKKKSKNGQDQTPAKGISSTASTTSTDTKESKCMVPSAKGVLGGMLTNEEFSCMVLPFLSVHDFSTIVRVCKLSHRAATTQRADHIYWRLMYHRHSFVELSITPDYKLISSTSDDPHDGESEIVAGCTMKHNCWRRWYHDDIAHERRRCVFKSDHPSLRGIFISSKDIILANAIGFDTPRALPPSEHFGSLPCSSRLEAGFSLRFIHNTAHHSKLSYLSLPSSSCLPMYEYVGVRIRRNEPFRCSSYDLNLGGNLTPATQPFELTFEDDGTFKVTIPKGMLVTSVLQPSNDGV
jgi:hypothetical protein